jgi:hypothetical protein
MSKRTTIQLFKNIKTLVEQSRQELYVIANTTLTETYFNIGRYIVEYEQQGSKRAVYAKETLINLSGKLTTASGKGFSTDNLENMRKFYLVYKEDYIKHISKNQKSGTVFRKLSLSPFKLRWSYYILLANIDNSIERKFYEIETIAENWSVRELKRQYESALFERLALSRNKAIVKELSKKGHVIENPSDAIKDPYLLEFLDLQEKEFYSETDLEKPSLISWNIFYWNWVKVSYLFTGRKE